MSLAYKENTISNCLLFTHYIEIPSNKGANSYKLKTLKIGNCTCFTNVSCCSGDEEEEEEFADVEVEEEIEAGEEFADVEVEEEEEAGEDDDVDGEKGEEEQIDEEIEEEQEPSEER